MNLATFLTLGAPSDVDMAAWEVYFENLRNSTVRSWNEARGAYLSLKKIKDTFGEPFIIPVGEGDPGTGISSTRNQEYLDLAATNDYLARLMDDVLAGKRRVFYVAAQNDFAIEMLDTDTAKLDLRDNRTVLVDRDTGQPVPVEGSLGIAPVIWGGIVAGVSVAAMTAYYFINESNNQQAKVELEENTKRAIANKQAELVSSGKATPEQAKQMTDSIYVGAKDLELAKAQTEKAKKNGGEGIQETIKTAMWIGLGIGALYFLARVIPAVTGAAEKTVEDRRRPLLTA